MNTGVDRSVLDIFRQDMVFDEGCRLSRPFVDAQFKELSPDIIRQGLICGPIYRISKQLLRNSY